MNSQSPKILNNPMLDWSLITTAITISTLIDRHREC